MKNEFSAKTRELFLFQYECWECGKNTWDALHHCCGRGYGDSDLESSPFNAVPICNFGCHIGKSLGDNRSKYLKKTLEYLLSIKYQPTAKDWAFIEKYAEYYI